MTPTKPTQYPQLEPVPAPLVTHPSVDPELARGLINAIEHINLHPEQFGFSSPEFNALGKGCVICHVERLSKWTRPQEWMHQDTKGPFPAGDYRHIFWWESTSAFYRGDNAGRMAGIEKFITTGTL